MCIDKIYLISLSVVFNCFMYHKESLLDYQPFYRTVCYIPSNLNHFHLCRTKNGRYKYLYRLICSDTCSYTSHPDLNFAILSRSYQIALIEINYFVLGTLWFLFISVYKKKPMSQIFENYIDLRVNMRSELLIL